MKTSLDILPKDKQEELHRVVEIICEEFESEMIIPTGVACLEAMPEASGLKVLISAKMETTTNTEASLTSMC